MAVNDGMFYEGHEDGVGRENSGMEGVVIRWSKMVIGCTLSEAPEK